MSEPRREHVPPGFSNRLPGSWCRIFAVRDDSGEVVAVDEGGWIKTYERMDLDDRNDLVYLANDALNTRRRMDWRARLARRLLRVPFSPYNPDRLGAAQFGSSSTSREEGVGLSPSDEERASEGSSDLTSVPPPPDPQQAAESGSDGGSDG